MQIVLKTHWQIIQYYSIIIIIIIITKLIPSKINWLISEIEQNYLYTHQNSKHLHFWKCFS
jgi:hypothetical protein